MTYIVYGAGAIGSIVAARLQQQGLPVVAVARGAHREALERHGLRLETEAGAARVALRVVGHPREICPGADDVAILAMKTQDTLAAVQDLAACAPPDLPVFCAQNGVENERIAQRWFRHVYGMYVFVYGTHLAPGVAQCFTAPSSGIIDLGRYPAGIDPLAEAVARDLGGAGFDSVARPDIMRWKHAKLLNNLGNAMVAAYGTFTGLPDIYDIVQAEGQACYRAAGIGAVPPQEALRRREGILPLRTVNGEPFPGGSAWQSLARGAGSTEVDYLTGEIVRLGRFHGVPTPANAFLQHLVRQMALDGLPPASMDPDRLRAALAGDGAPGRISDRN